MDLFDQHYPSTRAAITCNISAAEFNLLYHEIGPMSHQMVALFNSRLPFLSNWSFNKAFDGQIHGGRHLQVRGTYEISNSAKNDIGLQTMLYLPCFDLSKK